MNPNYLYNLTHVLSFSEDILGYWILYDLLYLVENFYLFFFFLASHKVALDSKPKQREEMTPKLTHPLVSWDLSPNSLEGWVEVPDSTHWELQAGQGVGWSGGGPRSQGVDPSPITSLLPFSPVSPSFWIQSISLAVLWPPGHDRRQGRTFPPGRGSTGRRAQERQRHQEPTQLEQLK